MTTETRIIKCPACGYTSGVYWRSRSQSYRCNHCGYEWRIEAQKGKENDR